MKRVITDKELADMKAEIPKLYDWGYTETADRLAAFLQRHEACVEKERMRLASIPATRADEV
jgi:hypothetical protein